MLPISLNIAIKAINIAIAYVKWKIDPDYIKKKKKILRASLIVKWNNNLNVIWTKMLVFHSIGFRVRCTKDTHHF